MSTRPALTRYESAFNGQRQRAGELPRFDAAGQVVAGEALYGALV